MHTIPQRRTQTILGMHPRSLRNSRQARRSRRSLLPVVTPPACSCALAHGAIARFATPPAFGAKNELRAIAAELATRTSGAPRNDVLYCSTKGTNSPARLFHPVGGVTRGPFIAHRSVEDTERVTGPPPPVNVQQPSLLIDPLRILKEDQWDILEDDQKLHCSSIR